MQRTDDATRARILKLSKRGATNVAIAHAVGVSERTVYRALKAGGGLTKRASAPFGPGPQRAPNAPPAAYELDQPMPAGSARFRTGYHDHTFRAFSAPIAFEGWTVDRMRNAIAMHDQGIFMESSMLAIVLARFAPVFAALGQALAPALALPKHVNGGTRGLSRILRDDVEAQLAPRSGLMASPYFPTTLWGSMGFDVRMSGFAVLQHVLGDPDPETYVRALYTRRWPTWAVEYQRWRRTYVAITTGGPVDILNDGKFTIISDTEEPHFDGAIRALALDVLAGILADQAAASYVDRYGNPKWVGIMPEGVGVRTVEGDAFFEALATIQGPDGWGVLPFGSKYDVAQMTSSQSTVFKDIDEKIWRRVAAVILGSDGTMSPSTGVYSAPIFAGVRRDLVDRMLKSMVRGTNQGHVATWLDFNYAASIEDASGWVAPVLDIPLPDPDRDARTKSYSDRVLMFHAIVKAERDAGFEVTGERVAQLAEKLDIEPPTLAVAQKGGEIFQYHITEKQVAPDEVRARLGLGDMPNGAGSLEVLADERLAGKDKSGTQPAGGVAGDAPADAKPSNGAPPEMPSMPPAPTAVLPDGRIIRVGDSLTVVRGAGGDRVRIERPRALSFSERSAAFLADLKEHRELGLVVDQAVVDRLAEGHGVPAPKLAERDAE